jgi:serine/threonine protein kinase
MSVDREAVVEALPAYDIGGELGRGTWGTVFAGRERQLGREVAIKALPRAFGDDPDVRAGFASEARLLASLDHPHIVATYDFVEHEGLCLLVMERLAGGTVRSRFRSRGFTPRGACAVGLATSAALQHAHDKDVLHRDLKPENLMFSGDDLLKVTDFGMAEIIEGTGTMETIAGDLLGTPAYMALEQQLGEELTPATDVFAVGAILYELLSGELPLPEPVSADQAPDEERPWPLAAAAPGVPAQLAAVVDRAVLDEPTNRQGSATELGQELGDAARDAWGAGWQAAAGVTLRGVGGLLPAEAAGLRQSTPLIPRPLREAITRPFGESTVRPKGPAPQPAARAIDLSPEDLVPAGSPARQGMPRWFIVAIAAVILVPALIAEVLHRL